ncbi:MAG: isocitrate lyase/PEP mutase family protein [Rhodospirillaceae bacterium]|jgi:2-methylisocitrate lyase-like PEP mutase family enzyme|nr:isocitrate lyase/PEP mutase family protein [Rhodospirillaceae bacterium]MBT4687442.1 isocitrate lyase/PEP mutase family protein [Rhodospirillaceae bacterium]MBT5079658.1 isocitrate lyase/PEP mutase family protein [Rhodospirillaceae bacterium]MBT5527157.1 isocitrate lyase/PEP mutase family protein [Rhodospirillaceae bacterium]MBT5882053.1 isocitrate lyase/PEP mutase family protein [Rhodospirillaceae bacterium]
MSEQKKTIAQCLRDGEFVLAPGIFDLISARMADSKGFKAIYMTGYGIAASYLGQPDAGYATYTDMVGRASQVTSRTTTPLIADADTGFGGPLNVQHTIRGYEKAGVQAIQIEDQEFPKKCGHTLGRRVVPIEDMVTKIEVAAEARESDDFLIIARTDSRTTLGLDEALRRGEAFAKAGADIVFIESPESLDEMKTICANFDKPCFANMVEGGRTPLLSAAELEDIGFKMAIFPGTGFLATAQVLSNVYGALKKDGISTDVSDQLYPFEDMNKLMGFEDVWEFDKKYGD